MKEESWKTLKIEETILEVKTKFYKWKCPITGKEVSSTIKPGYRYQLLSDEGKEIDKKNKEEKWLKKFKDSHAHLIGAKILEVHPPRDYIKLDYDDPEEFHSLTIEDIYGEKYFINYDADEEANLYKTKE